MPEQKQATHGLHHGIAWGLLLAAPFWAVVAIAIRWFADTDTAHRMWIGLTALITWQATLGVAALVIIAGTLLVEGRES